MFFLYFAQDFGEAGIFVTKFCDVFLNFSSVLRTNLIICHLKSYCCVFGIRFWDNIALFQYFEFISVLYIMNFSCLFNWIVLMNVKYNLFFLVGFQKVTGHRRLIISDIYCFSSWCLEGKLYCMHFYYSQWKYYKPYQHPHSP